MERRNGKESGRGRRKKKEKKEEEKLFLCAVINHTCMYGSKHVEESSKWYNNST